MLPPIPSSMMVVVVIMLLLLLLAVLVVLADLRSVNVEVLDVLGFKGGLLQPLQVLQELLNLVWTIDVRDGVHPVPA
jgi:hypothetical protein